MKNDSNPMSLNNLPEYLANLRDGNAREETCIVDVGQIEISKYGISWRRRIFFFSFTCLILTLGIWTFNTNAKNEITVVLDLNKKVDPLKTLPIIVAESGGEIIDVKQKQDSIFEVKVSTSKNKKSLLEFLSKNRNIKKAE